MSATSESTTSIPPIKGGKKEGAGRKKGTTRRGKYEKELLIYLSKCKK